MAPLAWDQVKGTVTILNGQTNSNSITVPRATTTMTVISPSLGTHTYKIQSLDPQDGTTWRDVNFVELATATIIAVAALPENKVVVLPVDIFGGGNIRFVESASAGADHVFSVLFTKSD